MNSRRLLKGGKLICVSLCLALLLSVSTPWIQPDLAEAALPYPLQEGFEGYGTTASGYTSPIAPTASASQPWVNAVGGSTNWSVGEIASGTPGNHVFNQTDTTTTSAYVVTNNYWGSNNPELTTDSMELSAKAKITGANSTYAGLVAKYSVSGSTPNYYRFTWKKNSSSYQFYLEKVTGTSKISVPQTSGTPNASGVSVTNTLLNPSFDSFGYLPLKLKVIENTDSSLTLEGYYASTLVLSGTDTTPYATGQVGLYSNAGTIAFDDVQAATISSPTSPAVIAAPIHITATYPSTGAVKVSWDTVDGAAGYNVKMATSPTGPFTKQNSTPVTTTNYTKSGLTTGTTYYFVVSSVTTSGEGSDSTPSVSGVPKAVTLPTVTTTTQLTAALASAAPGDIILLENGNYAGASYTGLNGTADNPIVIVARNKGMAKFTSTGLKFTTSSYITLQDCEFTMTASTWIRLTGSHHIRVSNNYFHSPATSSATGPKTDWVYIDGAGSHHNLIDHNLMENKLDTGKFILFDGVSAASAVTKEITQYDTVEYNIFRNTLGRQENESESIRIGVSTLVHLDAHTTIQYNIFDHCDGDPEIVSVKSGANIIRYNYFIESLGSLSLRAGNGSSAYGNMFIGNGRTELNPDPYGENLGTGGIRIYGENHKVYNNYFQGLTGSSFDAAITFTTGDKDDLMTNYPTYPALHYIAKNVVVANNTLVNNYANIELGLVRYGLPPTNLTFANNIVVGSQKELIKIMTPIPGLTWLGNIMFPQKNVPLITGNSASLTSSEVNVAYPLLKDEVLQHDAKQYAWLWTSSSYTRLRTIAYKKLGSASTAINASAGSYGSGGTYSYVNEDMDREPRTGIPDVGADEYSAAGLPADTANPTWSGSTPVSVTSIAPRHATISWTAATDDTRITAYHIYQNNLKIDTTFGDVTNYEAFGLQPGTTYTFKVEAVDQANKTVMSGNTVSASTPALTGIVASEVPVQIALGGTSKQLKVIATYADLSTEDVTAGSTYTSSSPGVLTVSTSGWVTAAALGSSIVTAAYDGSTSPPLTLKVNASAQTNLPVTADTYVDNITAANADTNYSTAATMEIKGDGTKRRAGYYKVNLPALSDRIDTVQLKLYVTSAGAGGDLQLHGLLDDSWVPTTITASNQPERARTDAALGVFSPITAGSFVTFDITPFYKSQSDGVLSLRLTNKTGGIAVKVAGLEGTTDTRDPVVIYTTISNPTAVPATPASLTAAAVGGKVNLSWNASAAADSYKVLRSTNGTSYNVIITGAGTTTSNGYTDTSVVSRTTYYYKVVASNTVGDSTASNVVTIVP
ncbi:chondroitinase-B domain-containing protein [Paenibacillus baimaensis]|uniref:chondroitinase-B domain-containing protein n=1 Tax=Paenibacillus baimaensis TaxID=2982185 RepID=UPI0021D0DBCA|nr:chondroitinase-B domain-containing protein [Paenibacillus sp. WQ 127069]